MVPWRASRVGSTQSKRSTGAVEREGGGGGGQGGEHLLATLAHREAADAVAVEADRHRPFRALPPEGGVGAALDDPEQRLAGAAVGPAGPLGPAGGPLDGEAQHVGRGGQRRAHVEGHLDVGAQPLLDVDGGLGCEAMEGAVVHRAERHAVVVHLDVPALVEREDLEPTGVGQEVAVPAHEPVEAAQGGHGVDARSQHEVVGVGQHEAGTEPLEVGRGQRADRPPRAHRHEARRSDLASTRPQPAEPGLAVGGLDGEGDGHASPRPRVRSMASPKDRNRYPSAWAIS
jgi:hypothetical protein